MVTTVLREGDREPDGLSNPLLGRFIDETSLYRIDQDESAERSVATSEFATVVSCWVLQRCADYRAALQRWFSRVRVGGHLVVAVPHAFLHERQTELPSRWDPRQRRLYTPRALMDEVEEALVPNTYRVRLLADDDRGYDYDADREVRPTRACDVVLVLEKIAPPAWNLRNTLDMRQVRGETPDYAFKPSRTRIEVTSLRPRQRILLLKLDHLGDFIMGLTALRRARQVFADAHLTLVVGTWNEAMARESGFADEVIGFDAFPRNSTEEEPNVVATIGRFREVVPKSYDLAIDLRTDHDTRVLLREVHADLKAGIGTRGQFPFLDIFLPLDFNRNEPERAREEVLNHHSFSRDRIDRRQTFRDPVAGEEVRRGSAIIWGPYHLLRAGSYIFEPFIEYDRRTPGMLRVDISLDTRPVVEKYATDGHGLRLPFEVHIPETRFEFRVWTVDGQPVPDFSFFGGRLIREGGASVLHQSEYISLLIELVAMRTGKSGMLMELTTG